MSARGFGASPTRADLSAAHASIVLAAACLVLILSTACSPADAVTWAKVNGKSAPVTFSIGDDIVLTLDCAAEGNTVRMTFALDLNGDGKYQEGEPVDTTATLVDQDQDADPTPRLIAVPFHVNPSTPPGPYVGHFVDDDGSVLDLTATVLPAKYPQSISGKALGEDGKPVPTTLVWVRNPDNNDEVASNWVGPDGSFTVEVPAGTFKVHTETFNGVDSLPRLVTVRSGESVTGITFVVRSGVLISGTVKDSSDAPVAYALLQAEGNGLKRQVQSFVDGTYSFAVPPGDYSVSLLAVQDPGTVVVTVAEGQPARNTDFVLDGTGRMEGKVTLASGGFDPTTIVRISAGSSVFEVSASDQGGAYALAAAPGSYKLVPVLANATAEPADRTATVAAGKVASGLDFVLTPKPTVVPGDLDGNGQVTIADTTVALRIAVGLRNATPQELAAGDINQNGKVDVADVTRILRKAVGLEA